MLRVGGKEFEVGDNHKSFRKLAVRFCVFWCVSFGLSGATQNGRFAGFMASVKTLPEKKNQSEQSCIVLSAWFSYFITEILLRNYLWVPTGHFCEHDLQCCCPSQQQKDDDSRRMMTAKGQRQQKVDNSRRITAFLELEQRCDAEPSTCIHTHTQMNLLTPPIPTPKQMQKINNLFTRRGISGFYS